MNTAPANPNAYLLELAKDVLASLAAQAIRPVTGSYVGPDQSEDADYFPHVTTVAQLRGMRCEVCVAGSVLRAHLLRQPDDEYIGYINERILDLKMLFGEPFSLMEGCFEGFAGWGSISVDYKHAFPDERQRFQKVMENIVRNEGAFVPEQDLEAEAA
jgi:hypothetical protein